MRLLLGLIRRGQPGQTLDGMATGDAVLIDVFRATLNNLALDPAFREIAIALPSEVVLAEQVESIDPQAIHVVRKGVRETLARALHRDLLDAYRAHEVLGPYNPDAVSAGRRALKNTALSYLAELDDNESHDLAQNQYDRADNMTDRLAALSALVNSSAPGREIALEKFYREFENEPLVIDKWFMLQATARDTDVAAVQRLMRHPAFTLKNPNRARSLIFSFCNGNPAQFHASDGRGYEFWAEQVIALNALNPQVAARLVRTLDRWRKYVPSLQKKMRAALQKVATAPALSNDVLEVVTKALKH